MRYFFMANPVTRTIKTELSAADIHKKLDNLNYVYKDKSSVLDFDRNNFSSYFQDGDEEFVVENSFEIHRQGTYSITGNGTIIPDNDGYSVQIEYYIDNSYLRTFLTIYYSGIALFWTTILLALIIAPDGFGSNMILGLFILTILTISPLLYKVMMAGYMHSFHSKVLKAINKS